MVNWKAASFASGLFSVIIFIISFIIYAMYMRCATGKGGISDWLTNMDKPGVLPATIMEASILILSVIIWGLSFGEYNS